MIKQLVFLLLLLSGCKASQPAFLELKAYSPSQNYTTYWFGNFPNRLVLVDTANAYQFPDTIFLTKTKFYENKKH